MTLDTIRYSFYFTCGNWSATCERIACVISRANTDSIMINHSTVGVEATSARAWINTFLIDARFLQWAIVYIDTFGTTCRRTAKVAWQTRANRLILLRQTLTVRATWRWYALIFVANRHSFSNGYARHLCVSCVSRWAATNREMIRYTTCGR